MNFLRWSYRLIIPRRYKKLPPGSYEATIDKIGYQDGIMSLRLNDIKERR